MTTRVARRYAAPAVKLGVSRQVVIPKKIYDELGLAPGDYLEVELDKGRVVFAPKTLVDKRVEKRLAEALDDIQAGRVHGPFRSAKEVVRSLRSSARAKKR